MEVTDALIEKLAHLSRLQFTDEALQEIKKDIGNMLVMVNKMNEVNTEGVEPLLHMSTSQNMSRADKVGGQLSAAEALKNTADNIGSFFTVPKVIAK